MKIKVIFSFLGLLLVLFVGVPILRMLISADPGTLTEAAGDTEVLSSIFLIAA